MGIRIRSIVMWIQIRNIDSDVDPDPWIRSVGINVVPIDKIRAPYLERANPVLGSGLYSMDPDP